MEAQNKAEDTRTRENTVVAQNSAPETSGAPRIGGALYLIGGLLLLSCLGGFRSLIGYTLGDPSEAFPDAPQMFFIAQIGATGVAFALHVWAVALFFGCSRKFPAVFSSAMIANVIFSGAMSWWASSFMDVGNKILPGFLSSGLLASVLILYCWRSKRAIRTFIK